MKQGHKIRRAGNNLTSKGRRHGTKSKAKEGRTNNPIGKI
jgi:hypothetical protein